MTLFIQVEQQQARNENLDRVFQLAEYSCTVDISLLMTPYTFTSQLLKIEEPASICFQAEYTHRVIVGVNCLVRHPLGMRLEEVFVR